LPGAVSVVAAPRPLAIAIAYSRLPLPMTRADQMTVAHLIAFLSARGHAVDLYALDSGETMNPEQRVWLSKHCRSIRLFPHGLALRLKGLLWGLVRGYPLQVGWFHNSAQKGGSS